MSKIEPHVIAVGFQSTKELLSLIQTKNSDLVSLSHFPFLFGNHINNSRAQVLLSAHGTLEGGQFNSAKGCLPQKKTEMWDIVPKDGRGSRPDPKFF